MSASCARLLRLESREIMGIGTAASMPPWANERREPGKHYRTRPVGWSAFRSRFPGFVGDGEMLVHHAERAVGVTHKNLRDAGVGDTLVGDAGGARSGHLFLFRGELHGIGGHGGIVAESLDLDK